MEKLSCSSVGVLTDKRNGSTVEMRKWKIMVEVKGHEIDLLSPEGILQQVCQLTGGRSSEEAGVFGGGHDRGRGGRAARPPRLPAPAPGLW